MKKYQIMRRLFGYQSEEEEANSKDELLDLACFVSDGDLGPESEGKTKSKEETKVNRRGSQKGVHHDHLRSSRSFTSDSGSPDKEKGKDPALFSAAVIHDVFGYSDDDEPVENVVPSQNNEKNGSTKHKGNYAEESQLTKVIPEDLKEYEEECTKTKLKGKGVAPGEVFQIPLRPLPVHRNKMATVRLSNLIGIDPKPFDPMTYVEEDIYVTDASGSRRCPPANIIRFKEVRNPDGTTSVESNAQFVEWSDGSLQLLIGDTAFNVSEQDAKDIQSYLFLRHGKGIYQSQGRISRKMVFMPSSLSSNSHRRFTPFVGSRHKMVNKVQPYISDVDPEGMMEQNKNAEKHITKASKQLNENKKKVIDKYRPKGLKECQLTARFLEDTIDEDNEQDYYEPPSAATLHDFDRDLKMEAAAEKRIMKAKMRKNTWRSALSSVELTKGALHISKEENVELEHEFRGNEVEGPISRKKVEGMWEGEEEELYEDYEGPKDKGKDSGSNIRKQFIESDDDAPPRKTATRRRTAIIYDSSDE